MRMRRSIMVGLILLLYCMGVQIGGAQDKAPLKVVTKTVKAIGYTVGGGKTTIDFKGTELMPEARGTARVKAKKGYVEIDVDINNLSQPTMFGAEFLTYVLWAVSPDGRSSNLGELIINKKGNGKLKVSTQLSVFSLLVTAEPYFAVRQPSEILVLENEIRSDTIGTVFLVKDYKLMEKTQYQKLGNPLSMVLDLRSVPLDMYEARNAVDIARSRGAEKYASEIFAKAEAGLKIAEKSLVSKAKKQDIASTARQVVQFSEDARALATRRQEEERIIQEQEAAAAKAKAEAEAKASAAAADAKRQAELAAANEALLKADAKRQAELAAANEALLKAEAQRQTEIAAANEALLKAEAQRQAEMAAARETQMKAEADAAAARAQAEADALRAKEEAAQAEAKRAREAAEALRAQLLEQFNRILETRDTLRGLVVNMADVLFDTGKYNLAPLAREKLARLAGIVLSHPELKLEIEGHTDSTGSEELNQRLSEQRGSEVRRYLIEQGLPEANITAKGLGETMPVADNNTRAGRQKNRRVEIIVSGDVIGTSIGEIKQ
jgi:outer membrane protein OmpA-like peptidoglycan-associated protein